MREPNLVPMEQVDFMFRLSAEEFESLRRQLGTSRSWSPAHAGREFGSQNTSVSLSPGSSRPT